MKYQRPTSLPTQAGTLDEYGTLKVPSPLVIWLRRDFPWLLKPGRAAVAGLVLLLLLMGSQQAVSHLKRVPQQPVQVEVQQLRTLLSLVEECRGTEALLLLLPAGEERDAAADKLLQQQARVTAWLQRNDDWLVAEHGRASVDSLAGAALGWWALQQRVVAAQPDAGRAGQASEARVLSTGPSADAYGVVVASVERMARRHLR